MRRVVIGFVILLAACGGGTTSLRAQLKNDTKPAPKVCIPPAAPNVAAVVATNGRTDVFGPVTATLRDGRVMTFRLQTSFNDGVHNPKQYADLVTSTAVSRAHDVNIAEFGNASRVREQISYDACVASHGSVIAVWFTDVH